MRGNVYKLYIYLQRAKKNAGNYLIKLNAFLRPRLN